MGENTLHTFSYDLLLNKHSFSLSLSSLSQPPRTPHPRWPLPRPPPQPNRGAGGGGAAEAAVPLVGLELEGLQLSVVAALLPRSSKR